jgi:para-nitrobenzyl esterase
MIDAAAVDAAFGATAAGRVRGTVTNGIRTFLGVPYAAPPVGDNRFAPSRPVAAWEGERDATTPGPCAPQRISLSRSSMPRR